MSPWSQYSAPGTQARHSPCQHVSSCSAQSSCGSSSSRPSGPHCLTTSASQTKAPGSGQTCSSQPNVSGSQTKPLLQILMRPKSLPEASQTYTSPSRHAYSPGSHTLSLGAPASAAPSASAAPPAPSPPDDALGACRTEWP